MISRRAFFTFLAGGAVLVGLSTAIFEDQIGLCDLKFAFRNCRLRGGLLVLKYKRAPFANEAATIGWKAWINGKKYGQFIMMTEIPTEEEAAKITELLQRGLDRSMSEIASRLA